MGLTSRSSFD